MEETKEFKELPNLYAEHVGFGLPEDAEWVGMGVATDDSLAKVYLPTLQSAEIISMWLGLAQQQAARLPLDSLRKNAARQAAAQPNEAIEAVDVRLDASRQILEINIGIGTLRFALDLGALQRLTASLSEKKA